MSRKERKERKERGERRRKVRKRRGGRRDRLDDRMCKAIRVGNVNDNVVRWNLADCIAALFGLRIDPRDDVMVVVV